MGVGFFIYTVALLVVCVLAAAICLSAYFVSHRSVYLMGMALFLFYLFDLALIFQSEYLAQNLTFDQSLFYAIEHPSWKIAMSAGFLASMWLIVCSYLDEARMAVKAAPLVLYVVLCLGVLLLMPIGADQQFWFYTMRQVFMAGAAIYVMVRYRLSTDAVERTRMRRHRTLFAIICIFLACITIEDAINIYMPPLNLFGPDFPLYLSERNFSENILIVIIAAAAMKGAAQTLSLHFEKPPNRENEPLQKHIDDLLPVYCRHHGLTDREGEVLRMILIGKDNQNIASDMQLALGTVKAHVHNILKKTGQATRQELVQDFWQD